jgi:hypothetical protein
MVTDDDPRLVKVPGWDERGRLLTEEELRAELDAVWPDALPRPTKAAISADGLWMAYKNETKGAK